MPMAARKPLTPEQQEKTRSAIQTSQLINRLQDFALGEKGTEIDKDRLRAIEILLRKSLPDLSALTLKGDAENPIGVVTEIRRTIVRPNSE